jgi:predicted ATPase/DNA-binding CsgD family transcriptional regulator
MPATLHATTFDVQSMSPSSRDLVRVPRVSTPLVGRRQERAAINALLIDPGLQLLTLTGPGGVGKTRLAMQCALDVADQFADGVAFVLLGAVHDLDQATLAVAEELDIPIAGNDPPQERLQQALARQRMLLVLDNLEHLRGWGAEIGSFLAACSGVKVLATSRSPLSVSDEREFEINPLPLPATSQTASWQEIVESDAVSLFVQRARAVRPDFAPNETNARQIAEICRRLDGLPLAIELAAVRTKVLNPAALLSRLANSLDLLSDGPRDAPSRLRTMNAATAWSYDLLDEDDRVFFRRLAVFRGSFPLAAAAAVALETGEDVDFVAIERIESLVDKSLMRQVEGFGDEPRFILLQTIREFALARLIEAGEETEIRERHANWCLAMLEEAEPHLHRAEQSEWLARLLVEQANFRDALAWTRQIPGDDRFPRMTSALWSLWFNAGSLREGRQWLDDAVASADGIEPSIRMRVLAGAGLIAMAQCDFEKSSALFAQAAPIAAHLEDPRWKGIIEFGRGVIEQDEDRPEDAKKRFEAAQAAFRDGDEGDFWSAIAIGNLGLVTSRLGDHETGRRLLSEGLAIHRQNNYKFGTAVALRFLGQVSRNAGDFEEAERCFEASLKIDVTRTQQWHVASALEGLGEVAAKRRHAARAARLLGAASQIRQEIGVPLEPAVYAGVEHITKNVRDALGNEAFATEWELGQRVPIAELIASNGIENREAGNSGASVGAASLLSAREVEILRLVASGRSSREIADAVFISHRTVTTHISNIFTKLDVHDRGAAIAQAYHRGILSR